MKTLLAVACTLCISVGCAQTPHTQTPVAQASVVKETESGFITAGKKYCKNHVSLYGVVVESKDSFVGKSSDDGEFLETKSSEIVILILCNDDYIFLLTGPNIDTLTVTMVKPEDKNAPKKPHASAF